MAVSKLHFKTIGAAVFSTMVCLSAASADDTEIFFSKPTAGADTTGNILFMFDTSGSMGERDGQRLRRIQRLKKSMIDVIDSGADVRMGIGSFNGENSGGAILLPPVKVDDDRCVDAGCDSISVVSIIGNGSDDGREMSTGEIHLDETNFRINRNPLSITTQYFSVKQDADDATEYTTGGLQINNTEFDLFGTDAANPPYFGIRYPHITVPVGSKVLFADIALEASGTLGSGNQQTRISVDLTPDTPVFADVAGQRILDRPYTSIYSRWSGLPNLSTVGGKVFSPNIAHLVQQRIDDPTWASNQAIAVKLAERGVILRDERRYFRTFEAGATSRLRLDYTVDPLDIGVAGFRFTNLNIPRGAAITGAVLKFRAASISLDTDSLTIQAENNGDAAPFADLAGNFSSRPKTVATATWVPDNWEKPDQPETTSDIAALVQEVVNRSDWCGGNAMGMFITGSGAREIRAYEHNEWEAPVLQVEYDPGSVDFTDTCVNSRVVAAVINAVGDVTENTGTGEVTSNTRELTTHNGTTGNYTGLRFASVGVPQNAVITSAFLKLQSAGAGTGTTNINIDGELAASAAVFDASVAANVSSRSKTAARVVWNGVPNEAAGSGVRSPDIGAIIAEITSQASWVEDNALVLSLQGWNIDTGIRNFTSRDGDSSATLEINYRLDSSTTGGSIVTLKTGRDELIDTMLGLSPAGGTPLIDAYFEAAMFMTGNPVIFGRQRGSSSAEERHHRVSAPDTYTGGSVFRPPGCFEVDLSNVACVTERIDGSPVYNPPLPAECQANQIVLMTDGSATQASAEIPIIALTGEASCEVRSNTNENCGLELSEWLVATDHFGAIDGEQPIITHTVGFQFSDSILSEIAAAGGGGFYEANSSGELTAAFTNIIDKTADLNTSFVAPSATISQSNRLANDDDLFFGLFTPSNKTRWNGNLKKYSLAKSSSDASKTVIVDKLGAEVFDAATGGIADGTTSYWSASADGPEVANGGAASNIALVRNILTYTDDTTAVIPLVDLHEDTTAITAEILGTDPALTDQRTSLLQWARGVDVKDFNNNGNTSEVRAQMGDPLHSVPTVLNYPTNSLVFMATNEGFLHAIDTNDGTEQFAFIPKQLLSNLDKFYKETVSTERVYGLDGPITAWFNDTNHNRVVDGAEQAYVVVGMRRGGRNYYALNVTNPDSPELAWVIEGGAGNFAELGQSWSKPVKTKVKHGGAVRDVLIFAAGYDDSHDTKTQRDTTDVMGRGIYIVDAISGERLGYKTSSELTDMAHSIPSTIRVIDINLDGLADMMFVGDLGGQVWRFDIANGTGTVNSNLTGGVIADLAGVSAADNRRFFYEPDIAILKHPEDGDFLNIAIGSGWRAHPLNMDVEDRIYALRSDAIYTPPADSSDAINYGSVKVDEDDLFDATLASGRDDTGDKLDSGWFIDLPDDGEKVLSKAVTINGKLLFTSYLPATGANSACEVSVGHGRIYALDGIYAEPANGSSVLKLSDRSRDLSSPGIPPSVSALIPESSENPVLLVGKEVLPPLDFGELFNRTYWAEY